MKFITVLFFLIPHLVLAHGSKVEVSTKSLAAALEHFSLNETPATLKKYMGLKQWMEGHEVRIKFYLTGDPKEIRYACHEMHGPTGNDIYHCEKKI